MQRRPDVLIKSERQLLGLPADGPSHGDPLAEKLGRTRPKTYEALRQFEARTYLKGAWDLEADGRDGSSR